MYKTEFRPYISFDESVGGLVYSFYTEYIPTNKEIEEHLYKYLNMGESPVFSKETNNLINKDILNIEDKFTFNVVNTNNLESKYVFAKLKRYREYFNKIESYFNIIGYSFHEGNLYKLKSLYEAFFKLYDVDNKYFVDDKLSNYSREDMKNNLSIQLTTNGLPLIKITTKNLKNKNQHIFLDY